MAWNRETTFEYTQGHCYHIGCVSLTVVAKCTVSEILSFSKIYRGHVTVNTPTWGTILSIRRPSRGQPVYKIWSLELKPFQRYFREMKNLKWVTWRYHAPFRDSLSCWDLLYDQPAHQIWSLYAHPLRRYEMQRKMQNFWVVWGLVMTQGHQQCHIWLPRLPIRLW